MNELEGALIKYKKLSRLRSVFTFIVLIFGGCAGVIMALKLNTHNDQAAQVMFICGAIGVLFFLFSQIINLAQMKLKKKNYGLSKLIDD